MLKKTAVLCLALSGLALPAQEKAAPRKEPGLTQVLAKYGLTFYGHLRLDMAYDQARTNSGNTASYVKSYSTKAGTRDDEFNMTAQHTRFGVKIKAGSWECIKQVLGTVEIDFYDKSTFADLYKEQHSHGVRIRHAFVNFIMEDGWELLAGQTWDLIGVEQMKKLNTLVGWNQGNIGYRRAQLRVTKQMDDFHAALAICRPIARDVDGGGDADGEDAAVPDVQGRIGWKCPDNGSTVGLGFFYGDRRVEAKAATYNKFHYNPYGIVLDFKLNLDKEFTLFGEAFYASAAGAYNAGIFQEVVATATKQEEIVTRGGFLNLMWKPAAMKRWFFVVGAGLDDPENKELGATGKSHNSTIFVNARYKIYKQAWIGVEFDRMETDYINNPDRINYRTQMSIWFPF